MCLAVLAAAAAKNDNDKDSNSNSDGKGLNLDFLDHESQDPDEAMNIPLFVHQQSLEQHSEQKGSKQHSENNISSDQHSWDPKSAGRRLMDTMDFLRHLDKVKGSVGGSEDKKLTWHEDKKLSTAWEIELAMLEEEPGNSRRDSAKKHSSDLPSEKKSNCEQHSENKNSSEQLTENENSSGQHSEKKKRSEQHSEIVPFTEFELKHKRKRVTEDDFVIRYHRNGTPRRDWKWKDYPKDLTESEEEMFID